MVSLSKGDPGVIIIYNEGIEFTIMLLLLATVALYLIIYCSGFQLKKIVGLLLLGVYIIFVTIGILMNMGILGSLFGGGMRPNC